MSNLVSDFRSQFPQSIIYLLLVFIIIRIITTYIIKPLSGLSFYRKQGIDMTYHYFSAYNLDNIKAVNRKNNYYAPWIAKMKKEPRPKAFGGNFGSEIYLVLLDPTVIKDFVQNHYLYVKHLSILRPLKELCGGALVCSEGDEWKRKRRILSEIFHFSLIANMTQEINEITLA
jgi:cytochrome P450